MHENGQVFERRMTAGSPEHVKHIRELRWQSSNNGPVWYTRAQMVSIVDNKPSGTFFTKVGGYKASLYTVHRNGESWVQTVADETRKDNLLYLPLG
jgi:hypothetical protein